jgi:Flp pilus assembly protein TadG
MSTTKRSKRSRGRGQSLVEFALVFPVFMLVLSGILDFGFLLYSRMTVINGAREGARLAVTSVDDPTGIPTIVDGRVREVAFGLTDSSLSLTTVCVHIESVADCDFDGGTVTPADPVPGDAVNVTVNYSYRSFFPLLFGTTFDLTSNVQMVIE